MEKYSHGSFVVTGVVTHIPSHEVAMSLIVDAWKQRFTSKTGDTVVGQAHPSMHAVYYNYDESRRSFDMLIWVMTQENTVQTNTDLTTLTIPAQDYRYTTVEGGFPESIWKARDDINHLSSTELPRSYGYDLEMYNEAATTCTIAVSVIE